MHILSDVCLDFLPGTATLVNFLKNLYILQYLLYLLHAKVLGTGGSGKSSLLKAAAGLLPLKHLSGEVSCCILSPLVVISESFTRQVLYNGVSGEALSRQRDGARIHNLVKYVGQEDR